MPCNVYEKEFMKNDMTENSDMMPEMMIAATAGKAFDGDCHCGEVRVWVTGSVGKF